MYDFIPKDFTLTNSSFRHCFLCFFLSHYSYEYGSDHVSEFWF
jgi:hypothetical protein